MFILVILVLLIFLIYVYPKQKLDRLKLLKYEVYKYSGLNPNLYYKFLNNIELMEQTLQSVDTSSNYLYLAIDNLQDIALYAKGGSTGFIDQVHDIASRLGNEAELMILEVALQQGVRFQPKYIKDIEPS